MWNLCFLPEKKIGTQIIYLSLFSPGEDCIRLRHLKTGRGLIQMEIGFSSALFQWLKIFSVGKWPFLPCSGAQTVISPNEGETRHRLTNLWYEINLGVLKICIELPSCRDINAALWQSCQLAHFSREIHSFSIALFYTTDGIWTLFAHYLLFTLFLLNDDRKSVKQNKKRYLTWLQ